MNHLLTVADAVAAHARLQPHKIGARDSRRSLSFAQWHERASRLANGLLALGLEKGDRVALLAYNCVEWMEIYVALARVGLVAVPINFRLTAPEICYIASHCEARAFIAQQELLDRVDAIRADLKIAPQAYVCIGAGAAVGWQDYEALIAAAGTDAPAEAVRPRRCLRADVHLGHHRPAQGCHPQPPGQHADSARHRARNGLHPRGHRAAGDADVPR